MYSDRYHTDVARSALKALGPYRFQTTDQPSPFSPSPLYNSQPIYLGEMVIHGITFRFGDPIPMPAHIPEHD